jgi:hypothetical protein
VYSLLKKDKQFIVVIIKSSLFERKGKKLLWRKKMFFIRKRIDQILKYYDITKTIIAMTKEQRHQEDNNR